MRPSRRDLLKASALSLAWLGGCGRPRDADDRATPTPIDFGDPTVSEATLTPGSDATLSCGSGPLPGDGWPYPASSWGRTNYAPLAGGPTEEPSVAWSALPDEPEQAWNRFTRPVVAGGRVYVGRRFAVPTHTEVPEGQAVIAYDASSGQELWRTPVEDGPETVALVGDRLLVEDGYVVHALAPDDGQRLWRLDTGDGVSSLQPAPDGALVVTHPGGGDQALLSIGTRGGVRWRRSMAEVVTSTPAWTADRAYLGIAGGRLLAVDTDGPSAAWTVNLQNGRDTAPTRVIATPCAAYVAIDKTLYALDRSGGLVWSSPAGVRELATDGNTVYGVDGEGYVRAFNVADGAIQWEQSYGESDDRRTDGFYAGPAVDVDTVFAGSLAGLLVAVDAETGATRWTVERDWETNPRVSVAGGTLYAAWGRRVAAFR